MAGQYNRDNDGDRARRDEGWSEADRGNDYGRGGGGERGSPSYRGAGQGAGRGDYGRGRDTSGRSDNWSGGDYARGDYMRGDYGRSQGGRGRADEGGYRDSSMDYPSFGGGAWEAGMGVPGSYGGLFGPDTAGGYDRMGNYGAGRQNRGRQGYGAYGGQDYGRDYGRRGGSERPFWDRASDEVASWFGDDAAEHRRQEDQHRGRGPKGYTRSDDRIREDVSDRLTDDGFVDASNIEVGVSGSEVTLTGTVDSRDQRRRAEDCAERVSGVTHVQNNLRVQTPGNAGTSGVSSSIAYGQAAGDRVTTTTRKSGTSTS